MSESLESLDSGFTLVQGSVTRHLAAVKSGDPQALAELWKRYYPALLGLARGRLSNRGVRVGDEEDVVATAFDAFYRAASAGHYPNLNDREALWRVLLTITANKAVDLIRGENAQARGNGRVLSQAALGGDSFDSDAGFQNLIGDEPTPEFAALVAESMDRRLKQLADPVLQRVALRRMEGFENAEIARELKVAERTVERKLALIRKIWTEAGSDS